tara:strand:+ start:1397 stop:1606 length:210 start_codon:yes stop_codon:yes gene_type:complete
MNNYVMIFDGKYVAVDESSGGYPHITDRPTGVKVWHSIEEAKNYRKMFKANDLWDIRELIGLSMGPKLP